MADTRWRGMGRDGAVEWEMEWDEKRCSYWEKGDKRCWELTLIDEQMDRHASWEMHRSHSTKKRLIEGNRISKRSSYTRCNIYHEILLIAGNKNNFDVKRLHVFLANIQSAVLTVFNGKQDATALQPVGRCWLLMQPWKRRTIKYKFCRLLDGVFCIRDYWFAPPTSIRFTPPYRHPAL